MTARLHWHSDLSFQKKPALATLLFAKKLPKVGGDTEFADMYGAYNSLPTDIKERSEEKGTFYFFRKVECPLFFHLRRTLHRRANALREESEAYGGVFASENDALRVDNTISWEENVENTDT